MAITKGSIFRADGEANSVPATDDRDVDIRQVNSWGERGTMAPARPSSCGTVRE
jgi:hypothetical protein